MAWEIDERLDGCTVWAGRDEKGRRVWKVTTNALGMPVEPLAGTRLYSRAAALEVYRADHPATPCEVCNRTGQETTATEAADVRCPECGETRTQHLCAECAAETRQAPAEALWCEDCRRKAAMA